MSNYIPLIVVAGILSIFSTKAFVPSTGSSTSRSSFLIQAKPKRLEENVEGVVYVNDKVSCCTVLSCILHALQVYLDGTVVLLCITKNLFLIFLN